MKWCGGGELEATLAVEAKEVVEEVAEEVRWLRMVWEARQQRCVGLDRNSVYTYAERWRWRGEEDWEVDAARCEGMIEEEWTRERLVEETRRCLVAVRARRRSEEGEEGEEEEVGEGKREEAGEGWDEAWVAEVVRDCVEEELRLR